MQEIKKKGFSIVREEDIQEVFGGKEFAYTPTDFAKIKVGVKTLDDAILTLGDLKRIDSRLANKTEVLRAIHNCDIQTLREVSNFFYKTSGIYSRLCKYMANLYRYDWMITPYVISDSVKADKIEEGFYKALMYLDNFEIKRFCGEVALKVLKNGCYYGYVIQQGDRAVVQELPPNYCRSRFNVNGRPAIEFNMKFFDDTFRDTTQKMKMLNLFPKEFKKGYVAYKEGRLTPDFMGDTSGWYLLEPKSVIKFNLNGEDFPAFVSVIPAIIDLNNAQALDRKKMQQKLLKIIIQKMPMDKNGDLIFDIEEAQDLHNNAVQMLRRAVGVDVLTTFADTSVETMSDNNTATTQDDLAKVERSLYNSLGIAQNLFNTDGNVALEKSILTDESSFRQLLFQFQIFFDRLTQERNPNKKKYNFKFQMLETTQYNYKEMSKLYKEQVELGYSKMLPQIALGHTQSSILNTAFFENEILKLSEIMIPPLSSNTMNAEAILGSKDGANKDNKSGSAKQQSAQPQGQVKEEKQVGRKEKPDDQKSEKTIQNRESMS